MTMPNVTAIASMTIAATPCACTRRVSTGAARAPTVSAMNDVRYCLL
jgi:hypothetical protein